MIRALSTFTLLLTFTFTAVMVFIRIQPYEDGGLRAFLTPPADCAAPCWLGIRPGTTRLTDGPEILQHSSSIGHFKAISPATAWLEFSPTIPVIQRAGLNLWQETGGIIRWLDLFKTELSLSEIFLVLGAPQQLILYQTIQYSVYDLTAAYPIYQLYITTTIRPCEMHQSDFWMKASDVAITLGVRQNSDRPYPYYYPSSIELDPRRWATELRSLRVCR